MNSPIKYATEKLATVKTIDTRLQSVDVAGQELLTTDKAPIRINFSAQYQINSIQKDLIDTKDFEKQMYNVLQLSLRAYIGTLTLDQLLANKLSIGSYILESVSDEASLLGVEILSGGIKISFCQEISKIS